jgi:chromosome segregation ATPase
MTVAPSSKLGDPALTFVAGDSLAQLRTDLTEALRSKGQLQARLKLAEDELEKSKSRKKSDTKTIRDLTTERSILSTKVADRDAELKGKAKLLEVTSLQCLIQLGDQPIL